MHTTFYMTQQLDTTYDAVAKKKHVATEEGIVEETESFPMFSSSWDCFQKVLEKEGLGGFYKYTAATSSSKPHP